LLAKDEAQGIVKELEVEEIFIKCARLTDNGKIPTSGIRDGAFSRKALLSYVQDQLVAAFENKETKNEKSKQFRVWIGEDGPANEMQLT
jgi:hypothetical protein